MKLLLRERIAIRAEKEIENGFYVNLGIGMPTLVANFMSANKQVVLQSETVCSALALIQVKIEVEPDLINAGKETVTAIRCEPISIAPNRLQ